MHALFLSIRTRLSLTTPGTLSDSKAQLMIRSNVAFEISISSNNAFLFI